MRREVERGARKAPERRESTGMRSRWLVLSPNEVRGTTPISMARLDLRFIIWGDGDPGHQFPMTFFRVITSLFISL
jgi:hypothetical protein